MACLGPHLVNGLMIKVCVQYIIELTDESDKLIAEKHSFKLLDILHHITSGMKAVCTEMQYKGGDEMR